MKYFYIELLCRDNDRETFEPSYGRPDCQWLYIPVYYAWQEDANDLHIQIEDDGENLVPREHEETGDYIIPATPWLLRHLRREFEPAIIKKHDFGYVKRDGVLVYHIAWRPEPTHIYEGGVIAEEAYLKALAKAWAF
jgi:hypothetical protein